MLFACSSGATVRYLEDIVRAIALPAGSHLQFRYATQYIDPDLLNRLRKNKAALVGKKIVLAYLDQSPTRYEEGKPPKVVPSRVARVVSVDWVGSSVTLVNELEGFAFPEGRGGQHPVPSYDDYQETLLASEGCPLPVHWKSEDVPQRAKGYWLCDVEKPSLETLSLGEGNQAWERWEGLVRELGRSIDFRNHGVSVFYHLLSVRNEETGDTCEFEDGRCVVARPGQHIIKAYVFAMTEEVPKTTWLRVRSLSTLVALQFNPQIAIDSGYDVKRIRFNVPESTRRAFDVLSFDFLEDPTSEVGKAELDIVLDVEARLDALIASSFAIGLAGSVPALLALWKTSKEGFPFALAGLMVLASCALSFVGSYYRKT